MTDVPLLILTGTVWVYWTRVGLMVVRARRNTGDSAGLVPKQPLERLLWVVWVPLVAAWLALPWLALTKTDLLFAVPEAARQQPAYAALRWAAAICAVLCLAMTQKCWTRMGRDWRMDVRPDRKAELITDGLFARVRHPIYAFSILLMLCSLAIVPTPPMLLIATAHVVLMNVKARNEERHLAVAHGDTYARYLRESGRFFPRRLPPSA
ncbi:MAG: isoprenylcysteine carboxylmethyltransferase family protein [Betaproteobacteria bacterium]